MKKLNIIIVFISLSFALAAQNIDVYHRPVTLERDRDFDALHYCLKLDVDINEKKLSGQNTITLVPLRNNLKKITLDAVSLLVTDVFDRNEQALSFVQTEDKLIIDLANASSYPDTVKFSVYYHLSKEVKGLRFIDKTDRSPLQVSSDCWPNKARQWIPCHDYPHDKVTQEMIVTVDKKYKVLSNGALVGITEKKGGKHTYHWKQSKPHSTYLVNLSIADYAIIKDSLGLLPVNYWVYHSNVEDARRSFAKTPDMIAFFNKLYDYEYPWEKYDQVISAYMGGGAEATSATLLGEGAVTNKNAAIDFSFEGIIAHEVAHQWWGDLITCRSWEHTWMNESFATYSDYLYKRYDWGKDESDYDLLVKKNRYLREAHDRYMRPVVFNRYEEPGQNFDSHTYPKGACILHMLKYVLGEDTFFRTLSTFLHKHEFQAVSTQDFMKCVKDVSGLNMDWFFEQFLYQPGHALFEISKAWDESKKILTLQIIQHQDKWDKVPIYRIPVNIGIWSAKGKKTEKVWLNRKAESYAFDLDAEPLMVRFDEGNHLLKEWTFNKSMKELVFQCYNDDVPGRLWAVDALKKFNDAQMTINTWSKLAVKDNFWAVREAALRNLSEYHAHSNKDLFLSATKDESSKVRVAALNALGNFHDLTLFSLFKEMFETDDSYLVMAEALKSIGKSGNQAQLNYLQEATKVNSPRNVVSNAAEKAIKTILE